MRELVILAAVAENGVIGRGGALPWHIPEDLERFRAITSAPDSCVIMGRRTWESIPAPKEGPRLPGRTVLVLSRSAGEAPPTGCPRRFASLAAALEYARPRCRRVYVAGGESVYREALPLADTLLLTIVHAAPDGDRFFPLDLRTRPVPGWTLLSEEKHAGFSFTAWAGQPGAGPA